MNDEELKIVLWITGLFFVDLFLNSFIFPLFVSFYVPIRLGVVIFFVDKLLKDKKFSESKTMTLVFLGGALGTAIMTIILALMVLLFEIQEIPLSALPLVLIIDLVPLGIGVFIWTKITNWFLKRGEKGRVVYSCKET